MFKNKYLKYKLKYLKLKDLVGGNPKFLNLAINSFTIDRCLSRLHELFSIENFGADIDRLSIGSGNGYFESLYHQKYPSDPKIICIDPARLSYNSGGLSGAFVEPTYLKVEDYKRANPKKNTLLFINWPDPEIPYDIDSIISLNPVGFFIIYAMRPHDMKPPMTDDMVPLAGSEDLHRVLNSFKDRNLKINDTSYSLMTDVDSKYKDEQSNLKMSMFINFRKFDELGISKDIKLLTTRRIFFETITLPFKNFNEAIKSMKSMSREQLKREIPPPLIATILPHREIPPPLIATILPHREISPPLIATIPPHTDFINSVALHPTLPFLASYSFDGTVKLWDRSDPRNHTLKAELPGHTTKVISVAFHPTLPLIASGSVETTVKLWDCSDLQNPILISTILQAHTREVKSVAFHPTQPLLASGSMDGTVKLWDYSDQQNTPTLKATIPAHTFWVNSVAFHPTLPHIASGSSDTSVKLWNYSDSQNPTLITTIQGHTNSVESVAFHPKLPFLASGSWDRTMKLWDYSHIPPTLKATTPTHTIAITSIAFHPTMPLIASCFFDGTVKIWRL